MINYRCSTSWTRAVPSRFFTPERHWFCQQRRGWDPYDNIKMWRKSFIFSVCWLQPFYPSLLVLRFDYAIVLAAYSISAFKIANSPNFSEHSTYQLPSLRLGCKNLGDCSWTLCNSCKLDSIFYLMLSIMHIGFLGFSTCFQNHK